MNIDFAYQDVESLRARMATIAPHFLALNKIAPANWQNSFGEKGAIIKGKIAVHSNHDNFYMSDVISKSSATMAQCVKVLAGEVC
jgi:NADH dehydrogenase (ubiquinone) Fe-S protein 1